MRFIGRCDISATPRSVPNSVDLGLKCSARAFPFPAIKFLTAWLHAWRIGVTLDLSVANVAENLQVVDRVGSVFALGHDVINLQCPMIGATADGASVVVFG